MNSTAKGNTHDWLWLVVLLIIVWALLLIQINAPWLGMHDGNGAWISAAVYHYHTFGAANVHFLIPSGYANMTLEQLPYYLHHPPLVVWLSVLADYLFGSYETGFPLEMSMRMVSVYATMLSLAAFYVLCRRLFGKRYALFALFLYAMTPMVWYYGRMPNHEPLALVFLYLFGAVFINWMRTFTWTRTVILAVLAVLAMWTMWAPAFYFAALGVVALYFGTYRQRVAIIGIGILTVLMTALILVFYEVNVPGSFADLMQAFAYRTSNTSADPGTPPFTLLEFILRTAVHLVTAVSFGLSILGLLGIGFLIRRKIRLQEAVIWAYLSAGFLYMLVFRNAFNWHDYYKVMWMAGLAMSGGLLALYWWDLQPVRWGKYARPLVTAIVMISFVLSVLWFGVLQLSSRAHEYVRMAHDISTITESNAVILSPVTSHIGSKYYSQRAWQFEVDVNEVLDQRYSAPTYLILCEQPIGSTDFDAAAAIWSEHRWQEIAAGVCRLISLDDEG
jgi:4-amino-4-deoxy-L-arabinose transferase-like glycosyltransferase